MKPKVIMPKSKKKQIHEFAWLVHWFQLCVRGVFFFGQRYSFSLQILFLFCFGRSAWRPEERMCELDFIMRCVWDSVEGIYLCKWRHFSEQAIKFQIQHVVLTLMMVHCLHFSLVLLPYNCCYCCVMAAAWYFGRNHNHLTSFLLSLISLFSK